MLVTENAFLSNNRQDRRVRNHWLRRMTNWRTVDGVITAVDADDIGKYTVNLYENGFFQAKTHQDVDAYTVNQNQTYDVGFPCRCIINEENDVFLVHAGSIHFIEVMAPDTESGDWNAYVGGWPASFDPSTKTVKGLVSGDRIDPFYVETGIKDPDVVFEATPGDILMWLPYEGWLDKGEGSLAGTLISGGGGSGTGAVEIRENGITIQAAAKFLNIITTGPVTMTATAVADGGVELRASIAAGSEYQVLTTLAGNPVWNWVHAH